MSYSILSMIPWFLITFVAVGLHITSAVILLKERHAGPWLMLSGCAMVLLGQIGSMLVQAFLMRGGNFNYAWIAATSAFSALGSLLFAIGLLLFLYRWRAKRAKRPAGVLTPRSELRRRRRAVEVGQ